MPEGIVSMDARQVGRVARGIRGASKPAWKALRVRLQTIGDEVADGAKARAPKSSRIVVKARPTVAGNIRVSVIGEPGVAIENNGKGYVRHPVYAAKGSAAYEDGRRWTSKGSHPAFLLPEYADRKEWALSEMEKAYWDAFDRAWAM